MCAEGISLGINLRLKRAKDRILEIIKLRREEGIGVRDNQETQERQKEKEGNTA